MWFDNRLLDRLDIRLPIIQAPMAGACGSAMATAVSEAGGLGSLPCAFLDGSAVRAEVGAIRQRTSKSFNVNYFVHQPAGFDANREAAWRARLTPYFDEFGVDKSVATPIANLAPFDESMCEILDDLKPAAVSFHFGLPADGLVARVKDAGCFILSTATTVAEARWLEDHGCDAIIAQGYEAGGHRGMFLTEDLASQVGTMALVPQVVDAVNVPVIAAAELATAEALQRHLRWEPRPLRSELRTSSPRNP